jgi:hypothetical protein
MNRILQASLSLVLAVCTIHAAAQQIFRLKADTSTIIYGFNNDSNGRLCFINANGEAVDSMPVETSFPNSLPSGQDLTPVSQNGKYGYVNKKGEFVIAPVFKKADPFYGPLAKVTLATHTQMLVYTNPNHIQNAHYDKYAYIDRSGDTVFEWSAPPSFANDAMTLLRNPFAAREVPMTRVTIRSNPVGALVYFIPSHILVDDSDIVNQPNKLASRLQPLRTNATYEVYLQDYAVIVSAGPKARLRLFRPFPGTDYTLDFDFDTPIK